MKVAVIIPCYKVSQHICDVIEPLLATDAIHKILVVDDFCPESSGDLVLSRFNSEKISVLRNRSNLGVGGATLVGYQEALRSGYDIFVKMDGDGQMDSAALPSLIYPILSGRADYTKGNRFFSPAFLKSMPKIRLFGNSALSLINKLSSGYWNVMDPTNGFTAIHSKIYGLLSTTKINNRYFFESDMLFRLGTLRAVVKDVPIPSRYLDEKSNLKIPQVLLTFSYMYLKCFVKRILYVYFLRDLNAGSIQLLISLPLILFGAYYGVINWSLSASNGFEASSGTVMLAALPIILGFQLLLGFMLFDVSNVPSDVINANLFEG